MKTSRSNGKTTVVTGYSKTHPLRMKVVLNKEVKVAPKGIETAAKVYESAKTKASPKPVVKKTIASPKVVQVKVDPKAIEEAQAKVDLMTAELQLAEDRAVYVQGQAIAQAKEVDKEKVYVVEHAQKLVGAYSQKDQAQAIADMLTWRFSIAPHYVPFKTAEEAERVLAKPVINTCRMNAEEEQNVALATANHQSIGYITKEEIAEMPASKFQSKSQLDEDFSFDEMVRVYKEIVAERQAEAEKVIKTDASQTPIRPVVDADKVADLQTFQADLGEAVSTLQRIKTDLKAQTEELALLTGEKLYKPN